MYLVARTAALLLPSSAIPPPATLNVTAVKSSSLLVPNLSATLNSTSTVPASSQTLLINVTMAPVAEVWRNVPVNMYVRLAPPSVLTSHVPVVDLEDAIMLSSARPANIPLHSAALTQVVRLISQAVLPASPVPTQAMWSVLTTAVLSTSSNVASSMNVPPDKSSVRMVPARSVHLAVLSALPAVLQKAYAKISPADSSAKM